MTPFSYWIATALLAATLPQATPDPRPQLQIGVRTYPADGSLGGWTLGTMDESVPGRTWVDLAACAFGGGDPNAPPLRPSAIVWQYTGHIVEHTESAYIVEVAVRRMDGTAAEASPKALSLNLGEPVVLDEVPAQSGCRMGSARLEVRVVLAGAPRPKGAGDRGRGLSASSVGTGGAGGRGREGANATSVGSGAGVGASLGGGASGAGAGGIRAIGSPDAAALIARLLRIPDRVDNTTVDSADRASAQGRVNLQALPAASYDAELWLIQQRQGVVVQTLEQIGHIDADGLVREFPAVVVPSTQGPLSVVVAINLRPMLTTEGLKVLRVALMRMADRGLHSIGFSNKTLPMPGADDVVAFELPEGWAGQDLGAMDSLSIRIRITPVKAPQ